MKTKFKCPRCEARFVEGDEVILNDKGEACCWDCFQATGEPLIVVMEIKL